MTLCSGKLLPRHTCTTLKKKLLDYSKKNMGNVREYRDTSTNYIPSDSQGFVRGKPVGIPCSTLGGANEIQNKISGIQF